MENRKVFMLAALLFKILLKVNELAISKKFF